MDGMEIEFANSLIEDSNNDALSYTDCEFISGLAKTKQELMIRLDGCP
jgi:hypothetical protein